MKKGFHATEFDGMTFGMEVETGTKAYIINMYANRRNRNAGRNANSGNARRGALKSLVNV